MIVFDPRWVREFVSRCESYPDYARPLLYSIATSKSEAKRRAQIEDWVSALPSGSRGSIIGRLRDPRIFSATYSELYVAYLIRQCGHSPVYDHPFQGLTPDWTVLTHSGEPRFLVEVVTVEAPQHVQTEDRLWAELRGRIAAIEHYYPLVISAPGTSLVGQDMKPIVHHVQRWLDGVASDTTAKEHSVYVCGEFRITFSLIPIRAIDKGPVLSCGPVLTHWVDNERLRRSIRSKLRKYSAAKASGIPFVVAVIGRFCSALRMSNLVDVLFGQERYLVTSMDGAPVGVKPERAGDGMLTGKHVEGAAVLRNKGLSAVLWIEEGASPAARVIHNPGAVCPLPMDTFSAFANLAVSDIGGRRVLVGFVDTMSGSYDADEQTAREL